MSIKPTLNLLKDPLIDHCIRDQLCHGCELRCDNNIYGFSDKLVFCRPQPFGGDLLTFDVNTWFAYDDKHVNGTHVCHF